MLTTGLQQCMIYNVLLQYQSFSRAFRMQILIIITMMQHRDATQIYVHVTDNDMLFFWWWSMQSLIEVLETTRWEEGGTSIIMFMIHCNQKLCCVTDCHKLCYAVRLCLKLSNTMLCWKLLMIQTVRSYALHCIIETAQLVPCPVCLMLVLGLHCEV